MRFRRLEHRFCKHIPDSLEPGILYVSMEYATAVHSCCCGCGEEVVTPFTPTDWKMTFDGRAISLWPSVGNWSVAVPVPLRCQGGVWSFRLGLGQTKKSQRREDVIEQRRRATTDRKRRPSYVGKVQRTRERPRTGVAGAGELGIGCRTEVGSGEPRRCVRLARASVYRPVWPTVRSRVDRSNCCGTSDPGRLAFRGLPLGQV